MLTFFMIKRLNDDDRRSDDNGDDEAQKSFIQTQNSPKKLGGERLRESSKND